jgi:putative transposase
VRVDSARPHDVTAARDLLRSSLTGLPRVQAIVADRGLQNLVEHRHLALEIKVPPKAEPGVVLPTRKGMGTFQPLSPLWCVERAFAELSRWRRLSRCFEGTEASAKAWLEVASFGYMLGRLDARIAVPRPGWPFVSNRLYGPLTAASEEEDPRGAAS